MKHFLYLALCAFSFMGLFSCSKEDVNKQKIVGTWELEEIAYYKDGEKKGSDTSSIAQTCVFRSDGVCTITTTTPGADMEPYTYSLDVAYSLNGQNLTIQGVVYQVSFDGNKMFWTMQMNVNVGSTQYDKAVYTFVKK